MNVKNDKQIKSLCTLFLCLFAFAAIASPVKGVDSGKGLSIRLEDGTLSLTPLNGNSIRIRFTKPESKEMEELLYVSKPAAPKYKLREDDKQINLILPEISATFCKKDRTLTFKDKTGKVILQEEADGRFMDASTVQGEPTFRVEQHFVSPKDEYLYGMGQFQDGYLNIRGLTRQLVQTNTQISIPFFLSNKGYGLLWNNYGLTDFNPADNRAELALAPEEEAAGYNERKFTATIDVPASGYYDLMLHTGIRGNERHVLIVDGQTLQDVSNGWLPPAFTRIAKLDKGRHVIESRGEKDDKRILYWREVTDETILRSPVAQAVDYTVFAGTGDEAICSFRELTGQAPMMPRWALGYIHCRERYHSQAELLENAREFRKRQFPIDLIVQDWQYWGKYGWNTMKFDEDDYPDPALMVNELHDMHIRLMLSVWSRIASQAELGQETTDKGYYIPGTEWIDFFNPEAAAFYWKKYSEGLLKPYHIDAWWQDATEPENDDLRNRRIKNGELPGEVYRNLYPLFVNKTVYEGLRKDEPDKRVMILTRSGFSGMQRYAAATWSGDVGSTWETFRRQIVGGLGQMASGLPWWTCDAGGFFRPENQYTDTGYHEYFLRWFQAAAFFPLMRVHGYGSRTEPWRYGPVVEKVTKQYLSLRYRMLPYAYSQMAAVSFSGSTLMRPLVMDFPNDGQALEQQYQFMFGPAFLVAPVTEPGVSQWSVYLPENKAGWFDFWTGEKVAGGQYLKVNVDIAKMPLFVKAGSIVPLGAAKQYTAEETDQPCEIRIYPGADATFTLYEDEGDNYNYEKGQLATFKLVWKDASKTLELTARKGSFEGMKKERTFNIVVVDTQTGTGLETSSTVKNLTYSGKAMKVRLL